MPTIDGAPDRDEDQVAAAHGAPEKSPYRHAGKLIWACAGFGLLDEVGLVLAHGREFWWVAALWPAISTGFAYCWYRVGKISEKWRETAATWRRSAELWESAYDRMYQRIRGRP